MKATGNMQQRVGGEEGIGQGEERMRSKVESGGEQGGKKKGGVQGIGDAKWL